MASFTLSFVALLKIEQNESENFSKFYVIAIFYFITSTAMVINTVIVTLSDPSDPIVAL